jgi:hypothetical protein
MSAQEVTEASPKNKKKGKTPQTTPQEEPPSYDSLPKQINACSMEERQKLLEVFSTSGSDDEGF